MVNRVRNRKLMELPIINDKIHECVLRPDNYCNADKNLLFGQADRTYVPLYTCAKREYTDSPSYKIDK